MHETQRITELAVRAAREAGAIALAGFRSPDLAVETKADMHDLVTHYDGACEARIRELILAAYPDATIVGEEAGAHSGTGPLTWYVDPIDGTSNYARGIAMWAVSIGVASAGELVSAVIFDPAHGQLFWADERGAFLELADDAASEGSASATPLRLQTQTRLDSRGSSDPARSTVALNFPLARDLVQQPELALDQFARVTRSFAQVRGLGSTCIALAWVAAGWLDVTISFETNAWDVAAGAYLIRQAGGVFHGYSEGAMVPHEHSHLARHYYAAVQGGEFELLHEIMRTQSRGRG